MYKKSVHNQSDINEVTALIKQYPLGIITTHGSDGSILATHVPFILEHNKTGDKLILKAHIARGNAQCKHIEAFQSSNQECLVIFQGQQGYITPQWYVETKSTTGKAVPTWDYSAAHCYGTVKLIKDPKWILEQASSLSDEQEARFAEPWELSDAPDSYVNLLSKGIYGVEVEVTKVEASWKYSQEYKGKDHEGVVEGLKSLRTEASTKLADEVTKASLCPHGKAQA